jgi:hypothetical protein
MRPSEDRGNDADRAIHGTKEKRYDLADLRSERPELNLPGEREPHICRYETLAMIEQRCQRTAEALA